MFRTSCHAAYWFHSPGEGTLPCILQNGLKRIYDHVKERLGQADMLHTCIVVSGKEAHEVQQLVGSTQIPCEQRTCICRWGYTYCICMFMHIYIYIYIYICICVCMHIYICICMPVNVCMCTDMYIYRCVFVCAYAYVYVYVCK